MNSTGKEYHRDVRSGPCRNLTQGLVLKDVEDKRQDANSPQIAQTRTHQSLSRLRKQVGLLDDTLC